MPKEPDINFSRNKLNLPHNKKVIALLPGSRLSEIKRIGIILLKTALIAKSSHNNLFFVISSPND